MNTDSYFEIGTSHNICEDYALSGTTDTVAYAIVCDGCSSSKHSDVGARLLAHIAKDLILYFDKVKLFGNIQFIESFIDTFKVMAVKKCMEVKSTLCFTADFFDATLLMAICTPSHTILASWGDGYFILQNKTEKHVTKINFLSGAPYYLSYDLSESKAKAYNQEYGSGDLIVTHTKIKGDTEILIATEQLSPVSYSQFRILSNNTDSFYDTIILCSDGLATYQSAPRVEQKTYTTVGMLGHLTGYKDMVGQFVIRRMWAFKNLCMKEGIIHKDDISCSAIHIS